MSTPFEGWPPVSKSDRPKKIFVMNLLPTEKELVSLEKLGYVLEDVRSIKDKRDAVEATLEGIRWGTIEADPKTFKFLELEAKILKMTSHLPTPKDDVDLQTDAKTIDALLSAIPEGAGTIDGGQPRAPSQKDKGPKSGVDNHGKRKTRPANKT